MKLALNTLMWHSEPFASVLGYAADLGVPRLDLGALPGTGHLDLGEGDLEERCAALAASLPPDAEVVAITADHEGLSSSNQDQRRRGVEYTLRATRAAEILGAPVVGTSLGSVGEGREWQEVADNAVRSLNEVMASAPTGVSLAVDLHVNDVCNSLERAEEILAGLGSDHVGLAFDTSLLYWNHIDIDEAFDRLGDRLLHVHLRGATSDTFFAIPGRDEVDFARFLKRLLGIDYTGALSLELYEVEKRYRISTLAALREALPYLREAAPVELG